MRRNKVLFNLQIFVCISSLDCGQKQRQQLNTYRHGDKTKPPLAICTARRGHTRSR